MALETASYIHQLNAANPSGADKVKDGDDHLRMIKAALKATFPGLQGPLDASVTHTLLNSMASLLLFRGAILLWTGTAATVPAGWTICDGRTASWADGSASFTTPNFTDRVPAGVSATRAVGATWGQMSKGITTNSAGAHAHTASTSAAGAHSHGSGFTGSFTLGIEHIPGHQHYMFVNNQSMNALQLSPADAYVATVNHTDGISRYAMSAATSGVAHMGATSSTGSGGGHSHSIASDGTHTHPVSIDSGGAHSHTLTVDVSQPSLSVYFIMKL